MKGALLAAAAALVGSAAADVGHVRRHDQLRRHISAQPSPSQCGCVTKIVAITGEPTLVPMSSYPVPSYSPSPLPSTSVKTVYSTAYSTVTVESPKPVIPSPVVNYPNPGTYTISASTYTVTDETTVYGATQTALPSGHHTYGGVTPVYDPVPVEPAYPTGVPTNSHPPPPPSPPVGGTGGKYGITYSPYTDDGQCKDAMTVTADLLLAKIAGFDAVRIYSTDCDGLQTVGDACDLHDLNMIIGVFIDDGGIPAAQEQVDAIASWAKWDRVPLIVIGNEAIFGGVTDANSLAAFIASCAQTFKSAGYTGPITTTETLNIWQDVGAALCDVIDVIGANLHPFFNSEVTPAEAGRFVKSQMELVGDICPGKQVITLETGWPSAGASNGLAIPGLSEQAIAVTAIIEAVGGSAVLFALNDEKWKPTGEFGVEQSWGCIDAFE